MKLDLVLAPNSVLLKPCLSVSKITNKHKVLIAQMFQIMKKYNGIGLAAPQVGRLLKILVMKTTHAKDGVRRAMINPEIVSCSEQRAAKIEACLSFPGVQKYVNRPLDVTVKYLDENCNEHIEIFTGLSAQCVLHEIDHLSGICFYNLE